MNFSSIAVNDNQIIGSLASDMLRFESFTVELTAYDDAIGEEFAWILP